MQSLEIQNFKETLAPIFEAEPSVAFVYLYGSQATGRTGPMSDSRFFWTSRTQ